MSTVIDLDQLMKIEDVVDVTQLSKSSIRRKSADPADDFPVPIRIGKNCVRWKPEEIQKWIYDRPRVSRHSPRSAA